LSTNKIAFVGGQCSAMQTVAVAADELIFAAEFSLRAKLNFPQIYNQSPGEQRSAHTLFKINSKCFLFLISFFAFLESLAFVASSLVP